MFDFLRPLRAFDGPATGTVHQLVTSSYWDTRADTWNKVAPPLTLDDEVVAAYLKAFPVTPFRCNVANMLMLGATPQLVGPLLRQSGYAQVGPMQTSLTVMDSSQKMLMNCMRRMQGPAPFPPSYGAAIHAVHKEWVHGLSSLHSRLDLVVADGSFNVLSTSDYRPLLAQLRRLVGTEGHLMVRFFDRDRVAPLSTNAGVARLSALAQAATRKTCWNVPSRCESEEQQLTTLYSFPPLQLFKKLLAEYNFFEVKRGYADHDAAAMFPVITFQHRYLHRYFPS